MGLFNRNNTEKTYKYGKFNEYEIGEVSGIIYHIDIKLGLRQFNLPEGATGLSSTAISDMRFLKAHSIEVPKSFKKFNVDLSSLKELKEITLAEGIEEVDCLSGITDRVVQINFPSTIKKIGKNCYPVVQHLVLPTGTIEIATMFASHDTNLLSVNIPGTLKNISAGAFNQCKNLQSVILNEGVESSARDAFRNTNNLRVLEIPSTYNGTIDLTMESRSGANVRGNSKYIPIKLEEEKNSTLKIKIKRGEKAFEFNIRRGDEPSIMIVQNKIRVGYGKPKQVISIDCNTLEQGVYNIENGNVRMQQKISSQSTPMQHTATQTPLTQATNQQEELSDKLELIFKKAIMENLEDEDFEFAGLYGSDREQVIEYMREIFMKQASMKILRTDSRNINMIFNTAVNTLEHEKNMSITQDNLNVGGKKR